MTGDLPEEPVGGSVHIPETGLCPRCGDLVPNHPEVERVLASKGYKYYDPQQGRTVQRVPIRYCHCDEGRRAKPPSSRKE